MFSGDLFYELRKDKGLNQDDMAQALGVSRSTITNYETNKTIPEISVQLAISKFFNVSLDYLNGLTDIPHPYGTSNYLALPTGMTKEQQQEVAKFAEFVVARDNQQS